MTRRFIAVLTILAAVVGLAGAASAADSGSAPPRAYHDVCIGWSPQPGVYQPIVCINPPAT